jgi:hypothetical protein
MNEYRVFISHSSKDKEFANLAVRELRSSSVAPWIDNEQIITGDDIFERLGQGLQTMDVLVFIISRAALESEWIKREVRYAAGREVEEKRALVLPFIIDDTPINALDWFLRHRNVSRVNPDADGAKQIANDVGRVIERRSITSASGSSGDAAFRGDPRIDELIKGIGSGDWEAAYEAALEISKATDESGHNDLFKALLKYQELSNNDNRHWAAIITIESVAQLAPWLFDRALLSRMANHPNFSIRSSAASICMDFAQFAPDRVPVDILLRLATPYEDWYVRPRQPRRSKLWPAHGQPSCAPFSFDSVVKIQT